MNTKMLIATIVGAIAAFLLGWLVFGIGLMDFYKSNTIVYERLMIDPPRLWAIFVSNLAWAALIAYIFDRWANIRSFSSGFIAGMTIGFLLCITIDMSYYAFMNLYSRTLIIVDVIVGTLFSGVIAGIIAALLGTKKKEISAA